MDQINIISLKFQNEIVDIFNKYNNLPFLLKYYLFKEIWQKIEQEKFKNDYKVHMSEQPKEEVLTKTIELPKQFVQSLKNEKEK